MKINKYFKDKNGKMVKALDKYNPGHPRIHILIQATRWQWIFEITRAMLGWKRATWHVTRKGLLWRLQRGKEWMSFLELSCLQTCVWALRSLSVHSAESDQVNRPSLCTKLEARRCQVIQCINPHKRLFLMRAASQTLRGDPCATPERRQPLTW